MPYGVGGASLVSMGKPCGMGGSVLVQAATSPAKEVNGYKSFVAALKGRSASVQAATSLGFGAPCL